MFASLLRQVRRNSEVEQSPILSRRTSTVRRLENGRSGDYGVQNRIYEDEDQDEDEEEGDHEGSDESEPLLPMFSSEVLGMPRIYFFLARFLFYSILSVCPQAERISRALAR